MEPRGEEAAESDKGHPPAEGKARHDQNETETEHIPPIPRFPKLILLLVCCKLYGTLRGVAPQGGAPAKENKTGVATSATPVEKPGTNNCQ